VAGAWRGAWAGGKEEKTFLMAHPYFTDTILNQTRKQFRGEKKNTKMVATNLTNLTPAYLWKRKRKKSSPKLQGDQIGRIFAQ
jgi:hypothetical protein